MATGTCKLCKAENVKLAKSHIIPKSLYGDTIRSPEGHARLLSDNPAEYETRSPTGIWDQTILCHQCEKSLSDCDNYIYKVLTDEKKDQPLRLGTQIYYELPNPNPVLLRKFFISLIWRMDVSSHNFFSDVSLGTDSEKARLAVLNNNPDKFPELTAYALRLVSNDGMQGVLNPKKIMLNDDEAYTFTIPGYSFLISVSKQNINLSEKLSVKHNPWILRHTDFSDSDEERCFLDIARARYKPK